MFSTQQLRTRLSLFLPGKAAGYDNIPMSVKKQSIQPLTHIIILSIAHGIVPDQMKIAQVMPLYKADDQALFTNYRPVSILPIFSKCLNWKESPITASRNS